MKTFNDVKAIEVIAKEWFDKTYGNSYFSANVHIEYKDNSTKTLYIPFQYGYGDHYRDIATKAVLNHFDQKDEENCKLLWHYRDKYNFHLSHHKHERCLKREVVAFGKE